MTNITRYESTVIAKNDSLAIMNLSGSRKRDAEADLFLIAETHNKKSHNRNKPYGVPWAQNTEFQRYMTL